MMPDLTCNKFGFVNQTCFVCGGRANIVVMDGSPDGFYFLCGWHSTFRRRKIVRVKKNV